ncbi:serine/threonine-protein kinase SBK1-like [Pelodytes ibericus]
MKGCSFLANDPKSSYSISSSYAILRCPLLISCNNEVLTLQRARESHLIRRGEPKSIVRGDLVWSIDHTVFQAKMEFQNVEDIGGQYEILGLLGQGTFGKVLLARNQSSGQSVALKFIRKDRTTLSNFLNELFMSVLISNHERIITTYRTCLVHADYYILTQELAPAGTLESVIEPRVGMPEEMVKCCALQLTEALQFIHDHGIVHRDLKPNNVLLMDKQCQRIKLSDFGYTQSVGTEVHAMSHIIPYMAPELCRLKRNEFLILAPSLDIWAFGILLYVALIGYYPWDEAVEPDREFSSFIHWQNSGQYGFPAYWDVFTTEGLAMFSKLLSLDPSDRPSANLVQECFRFPWLVQNTLSNSEIEEPELDLVTIEQSDDFEIVIRPGDDEMLLIQSMSGSECVFVEGPTVVSGDPVVLVLPSSASINVESETDIT